MQRRLRKLRRRTEGLLPGVRAYTSVDTGPVMEKAWAVRAGVGWLGKHGVVLTRDHASFAFLGTMLLDRALPADRPATDRCGTWSACATACPTGAIVAPGVVDARLCISYLTVEHRGPIPRALRAAVGQRLFGCDDCQEICPWNRLARPSLRADWRPRPGWGPPGAGDGRGDSQRDDTPSHHPARIAAWTLAEWDAATRGMALRRAGYDGLRRNALVVLGNRGAAARAAGVPVAAALLAGDAAPVVRGTAAWALGELGGPEAAAALRRAAAPAPAGERDPEVRAELAPALARAERL
jgi:epoxyqueuosine reductase